MFEENSTSRNVGYFVPLLGTGLAILDAIKNPTWSNIGDAALSGVGDVLTVFGVGAGIKGAVGASKAAKLISRANKVKNATYTASKWNPKRVQAANKAINSGLSLLKKSNTVKGLGGVADAAVPVVDIGNTHRNQNALHQLIYK